MRSSILLLVLSAAVLGGCTSAYKTGQTPDDVYYSPQRPQQDEYVNFDQKDDSRYYNNYDNNDNYYDDQYLRMKVRNRLLWSNLDDWYYYNPAYSYSYYNSWNWNNPWSPYTYWNYYYNPYCSPVILTSKTGLVYNHPRMFNLNTYNSSQLTNDNYTSPRNSFYNNYNTNNNRSSIRLNNNSYTPLRRNNNTGSFLRNIFNGSGNNNSSFGNTNRTSGSVNTPSSSGSSSGSSSAPVRKF